MGRIMIDVLVVDDSTVSRELYQYILSRDPELRIAGTAFDGAEAARMVRKIRPAVVAMDFHMPDMDGILATRMIMEDSPVPVVIVSGVADPEETGFRFRALEAGALAILPKPSSPDGEEAEELCRTLKMMSEVRVVRRSRRFRAEASGPGRSGNLSGVPPLEEVRLVESDLGGFDEAEARFGKGDIAGVFLGASTGGPQAYLELLRHLPGGYPVPLFAVQHIAKGFLSGMIKWLRRHTPLDVRVAGDGDIAVPGCLYFAPEDRHMTVGPDFSIRLDGRAPVDGSRPSVTRLFNSAADSFGPAAAAVLMTGMGRDGADGLLSISKAGGVTVAQDSASSIVYGMPAAAVKLGCVDYVLSPDDAGRALASLRPWRFPAGSRIAQENQEG